MAFESILVENTSYILGLYTCLRGLMQTTSTQADGSIRHEMRTMPLDAGGRCAETACLALKAQRFVRYNRGHSHLPGTDQVLPQPVRGTQDAHVRGLCRACMLLMK